MKNLKFPVNLVFNIATISNDFSAKDADGGTICYVRQKMFKFVDEIEVFSDETRSDKRYSIKADKWIDFSTTYSFTDANGQMLGCIGRKGWASLWKAHYEILDENRRPDLVLREDSAWVKVMDGLLGEIPILGFFTGYVFNPSYTVARPDGTPVVQLKKVPSLIGRRFTIEKLNEFETGEEERIVLGLMMMILLERRRG
jgi:hypothetical protein